jgi:putative sigma-54 modulation protein
MQIDIKGKDMPLDEPMKQFVNDKIGGLEHYMQAMGELHASVEIGRSSRHHHKGPHFYAETNITIGRDNDPFRAVAENEDLRTAITEVKNELQRQIRRYKEKMTDRDRRRRKE